MYIQFVDFNVASGSRIFNFRVVNHPGETREFSVKVQSEAFRSAFFKVQDGPSICFERLKRELQEETQASPAEAHLSIVERDIQEYVERHHPRQAISKRRASDR